MKTSFKKILLLQITMIFFLVLNFFISNVFTPYVYVVFLGIMFTTAYLMLGFEKNVLIVILSYFLIIYLLGLKIGFVRTIYNGLSNTNITRNIIPFVFIVIFSELLRFIFINKSNKNRLMIIFSCIVFILFNISYYYKIYDFRESNELFQFVGIIVLGNIATNIFLTILCINTGYINNIKYRLLMEGYVYLVPFVPDLGPYLTAVLSTLVPVICALSIYRRKKHIEKASKNKKRLIIPSIIIGIFILIIMLNSGFFKYQNMTIGSNSMKPYMSKGDVIILEKLKGNEIYELKKGDILVFRYNNKVIAHRIYKVYNDETEIRFRTKGDANEKYDDPIINKDQVVGILRYRIKYIGLPSVWVEETFR